LETQIETALLFESVEQIYARVFRGLRPRTPLPEITVRFRAYANANSRIRLAGGALAVDISDTLEAAPAPIHEALAHILIAKLYRKPVDNGIVARYRRYLNRSDVRRILQSVKQSRGRKYFTEPHGKHHDLVDLFDRLNFRYFHGLMARPELGWSVRPSRSTLGHYDPSHHIIILSSLLDSAKAPALVVEFVMFHEMLHLKFPTEHRGARRCVHTPQFKSAEKEFTGYEAAQRALKGFLDATG
jgi:Protein of unknown function DUF45